MELGVSITKTIPVASFLLFEFVGDDNNSLLNTSHFSHEANITNLLCYSNLEEYSKLGPDHAG